LAHIALLHGTQEGANLYPNDPYWEAKEFPTFKNKASIPEDWRIKVYFAMISSEKKKKMRSAAEGRTPVGDELERELVYYLAIEDLLQPHDISALAKELIGLGIGGDFKCYDLKAKDISNALSIFPKKTRKGQPNMTDLKKAIIVAARKVGKSVLPNSVANISGISSSSQNNISNEDDEDDEDFENIYYGPAIPDDMTLADLLSDDEDENEDE
jgi:hypothetical protein